MSEIKGIVDSLEIRFHKLFKKIESLQQSNEELLIKLNEAEKTIQFQNQEVTTLKSNFDSIKITNSLLGSDEYKRDTKLKINSLIREIDYCIAQLSD
jgi:chromosome segregation ATPase